ncbi:MAG: putative UDP-glucuronate 5'-epimerase [Candidatus Desulfovibrio kirbyi]|uniref:Putative UDP-glucuronate 5'-epimerase n=1 Tax=Candidatus Desulfovibrio kirbyi TaxID=2696086 RepID=A0A6L2R6R2_9BACT|nr:MAG: putative UDP-glucuronate 5'-epimerase [Candidatus Desulfovibrio kirbyi]
MRILVTGVAGFIGFHTALRFLADGYHVTGIDNLNYYYDTRLKLDRLEQIRQSPHARERFAFAKCDLADARELETVFSRENFSHVVHLAAQAGVRYSLVNPAAYIASNLVGFANLLECCRGRAINHLVFASSSSVYGLNTAQPYATSHNTDHPASLYAATKKSNEVMAHAYSHLYGLPCTGLRFFTVYGPWGRPDMAPHLFTTAILNNEPLKVFNQGRMRRDFTCIDDVVESLALLLPLPPAPNPGFDPLCPDPAGSSAPWRLYNTGNGKPVPLDDFIAELERALGKKARREPLPMQPGDVESTWADTRRLSDVTGFTPSTPLRDGIARFIVWHKEYYAV